MIDPRVEAVAAKRKRVGEAMIGLAGIGAVYFFAMLFVLSEFQLGNWAIVVFLPFIAICGAVMVLRTRWQWMRGDAALEQVRVAYESLDALEADIAESKRLDRMEKKDDQDER